MVKADFKLVIGTFKILTCPRCEGSGKNFDHGAWVRCKYCYGHGIMPNKACVCGRPLRLDKWGQVDEGQPYYACGLYKACKETIRRLPEKEPEHKSRWNPLTWWGDDADMLAKTSAEDFMGNCCSE